MKNYVFSFVIVCWICFIEMNMSFAQGILTPDFVTIQGVVLDAENDSSLVFANVYNTRTMRGTITNKQGEFRYFALPKDTLWFSSLGYYPFYLPITDSVSVISDTFYLKSRVFEIPDVNILALTKFEKLRYDVKNMKIPKDLENANRNFPQINHDVMAFYERNNPNFGLVLSPISALYDVFSREGKERRKLAELMRQDAINQSVSEKFNPKMIQRITGLKEPELTQFIEYCNFSNEFLLKVPDYYLVEIILEQYEHFRVSSE
jgi:hypothetical protein